eukprot:CAMPEP_0196658894 /NCGR_PEP_ID=MMETSP1086-20130531/32166_1 /TAXON_ID=77921 /ORGANISM="Cyanoptyche  gloeocystis , Strain SAG4.97" /LENGTH=107 /DNA_ID=CAMNT_0041992679 /DNA_START=526 /DNA_END=849 /DNA_ORIENTATION=+
MAGFEIIPEPECYDGPNKDDLARFAPREDAAARASKPSYSAQEAQKGRKFLALAAVACIGSALGLVLYKHVRNKKRYDNQRATPESQTRGRVSAAGAAAERRRNRRG